MTLPNINIDVNRNLVPGVLYDLIKFFGQWFSQPTLIKVAGRVEAKAHVPPSG